MSTDTDRAMLLALALRLIASANGAPPQTLSITIEADGSSLTLSARPDELAGQLHPEPSLSPAEQALLRVATVEPQTAKAMARKASYQSLPHVRTALSRLCDLGLLERATHGTYRLPRLRPDR